MDLRDPQVATASAVGLALVVVGGDVAAAVALASAAPYLGIVEVALLPAVGATFAASAALVAFTPHRQGFLVLALVAVAIAASGLAIGLAQTSGLWVLVGAWAWWLPLAVLGLALVALRGDLTDVVGRLGLAVAALLAAVASVARVITFDPASWGWCRCVTNPFAADVSSDTYQLVDTGLLVADMAAVLVAMLVAGVALVRRPGRTGIPELTVAIGVLLWGSLRLLQSAWSVVAIGDAPPAIGYVAALALVPVLCAFLVRASRRRPSRAHVADLLLAAREDHDPARLRELVARAVGQPHAVVLWWDVAAATYRDHRGEPVSDDDVLAVPESRVLRIGTDRRPIAVMLGEADLPRDPAVLEPVAEALRLATENRRLNEELQATLAEVRDSRTRILTASDEARKRIERDLHDGAQQLLISTGVKLNLASSRVQESGDTSLLEALGEATDELGRALDELRHLASGITPTALVHGDLADAIEELALRCPVPTTVHISGETTNDADWAATAYFVVAESLANVAKHAAASRATVTLELGYPVRVTVADDGHGGADASAGSGLRGLADRVEAGGGSFEVRSAATGTTVTATVPTQTDGPR